MFHTVLIEPIDLFTNLRKNFLFICSNDLNCIQIDIINKQVNDPADKSSKFRRLHIKFQFFFGMHLYVNFYPRFSFVDAVDFQLTLTGKDHLDEIRLKMDLNEKWYARNKQTRKEWRILSSYWGKLEEINLLENRSHWRILMHSIKNSCINAVYVKKNEVQMCHVTLIINTNAPNQTIY